MPAPLPNTSRPPAAIVTNPLPESALGAAMSSVPPLTVVPPEYVFVPLRVNAPLPERAKASLPMMFPAKSSSSRRTGPPSTSGRTRSNGS